MTRERPILFSGSMVRAIVEDRKTETRRVLRGDPPCCPDHGEECPDLRLERCEWVHEDGWTDGWTGYRKCPYGRPGDVLWVREAFRLEHRSDFGDYYVRHTGLNSRTNLSFCNLSGDQSDHLAEMAAKDRWERAAGRLENGDPLPLWLGRWRPSIHMPKWACRLWLRVEDVRVGRLQEITPDGVAAEGIDLDDGQGAEDFAYAEHYQAGGVSLGSYGSPEVYAFAALWDRINRKRAPWASNPYVWIVKFSRTEAPDA